MELASRPPPLPHPSRPKCTALTTSRALATVVGRLTENSDPACVPVRNRRMQPRIQSRVLQLPFSNRTPNGTHLERDAPSGPQHTRRADRVSVAALYPIDHRRPCSSPSARTPCTDRPHCGIGGLRGGGSPRLSDWHPVSEQFLDSSGRMPLAATTLSTSYPRYPRQTTSAPECSGSLLLSAFRLAEALAKSAATPWLIGATANRSQREHDSRRQKGSQRNEQHPMHASFGSTDSIPHTVGKVPRN